MAKRKVKNKIGLPYNRFDGEGESMNMIQKSGAVANDAFGSSNLGGTIGSIGSGVTSIVQAGMNNAQIADTSSIQDQIKAQNNIVVGASDNASLLNEWSHLSMLKDNYSWKDIRGGSNANRAMNTIGGAAQGAMTGATVGGPIGAIAGAVIGLGSGIAGWITGNKKAKRRARRLNQQASDANERALLSFENRASDVDTQNDLNIESNFFNDGGPITMRYTGVMSPFGNTFGDGGIFIKPENRGKFTALKERTGKSSTWYKEHGTPAQKKMAIFALNAAKWEHADGGELHTQGGDFTNGLTYIDNGGSHEANPFEGVQMGIDPQGVPNLVEEGEVIFNDYVFSDRMKLPKKLKEKYNIKGETFADAAKELSRESEERPNDPISKRGLQAFMSALANGQEEVRMKRELNRQKNNKFAYGGSIKDVIEEFKNIKVENRGSWVKNNPDKYETLLSLAGWLRDYNGKNLNIIDNINEIESLYNLLENQDKEEIEKTIEARIKNLNNGSRHFKEDFYNPLVNSQYYSNYNLGGLQSSPYARGKISSYIDKAIAKYGMEKPISEITEDEWKKIYEDSQKEFENSILYGTGTDNSKTEQEDIRDIPGLDFPYMSIPQLGSIPRVPNIEVKNTPLDTSYIAYRTESELNDDDFTMEGADMPEVTVTPDVTGFNVQDRGYSVGFPSITPRNSNRSNAYIAPLDVQENEGMGIPLEVRGIRGLEFPFMDIPQVEHESYQDIKNLKMPKYRNKSGSGKADLSRLRYMPAIASGAAAISDLFSKPDYTEANRVADIDVQPSLVSAVPVGQYLPYTPLDRLFYINQLNRSTAAGRRAIQNNSGGNRATALTGLLAEDYNYGENLGKLARQAEEYNQNLREKTATFNRATDMFNSQQSLAAQTTNASSRNDATKMRLAQAEEVAKLRSAAKSAYDTRRSSNLNNFINNLGNIGWEDYQREWINSNPALYYNLSGIGRVGYKGNGKKNGGKLKKKGGTTYA